MVWVFGVQKDRQSKASRRSRYAGRNRRRRDSGIYPIAATRSKPLKGGLPTRLAGSTDQAGTRTVTMGWRRGGVGRTSKQGGKMGPQARRNLGKKRSRAYTKKAEHRAVII
ncbi:conserved hypothetical protein [Coccidioides posadasii str. Silveira]|uniref:Uncharacterized protein n=1 Tax=Coccidioides posadasii (strain RMSCC 757 / Silveira) TaxID=443226 RepID=E9DCM1_COCPS|nr:conserved hypothetical protein [Coccidioides posadasii str. Silveira]